MSGIEWCAVVILAAGAAALGALLAWCADQVE